MQNAKAAVTALLCVILSATLVDAERCPAGSDGDLCRTQCAIACNGHSGCDVDSCGLLTCDCSGHGDIDLESGKCLCDSGRNPSDMLTATDCSIRLDNTDCAQSQSVGVFQPP